MEEKKRTQPITDEGNCLLNQGNNGNWKRPTGKDRGRNEKSRQRRELKKKGVLV